MMKPFASFFSLFHVIRHFCRRSSLKFDATANVRDRLFFWIVKRQVVVSDSVQIHDFELVRMKTATKDCVSLLFCDRSDADGCG